MMLILMATTASGVLASRALLWWGIGSVKVRYPLNVAIAYLVFLLLVRLWIAYVRSSSTGSSEDLLEVDDFASPSSPAGGSSWFDGFGLDLDGEGALILIVLAVLILVILSAGAYLVWMAPEILGEAAFNAVLAANLVKVSNRLEREGWIEGVVRATWIPFGAVLAITLVLAFVVHNTCPPASTMREALSCPVRFEDHSK